MRKITKPALLLDKEKCISNINKMVLKAQENKVMLRPHFKTHFSAEISQWFRGFGIDRITVSSVSMAKYFYDNGWSDITIAFPFNILEINDINSIAEKCNINLVVVSKDIVSFLVRNLTRKAGIFIKIDVGYNRTGLDPDETGEIEEILELAHTSGKLAVKGFLAHAGHTYKAKSADEIKKIHQVSLTIMKALRDKFSHSLPGLICSIGDTPSCSIVNNFPGIDEIRPGNFVFYDLKQESLGSCKKSDIAVAVECPVAAVHKQRGEIIIYGGAVHFSKDSLQTGKNVIYGLVVETAGDGWGNPVDGVWLSSLSQEHGTIKAENERFIKEIKAGQTVMILPVHSCLTANCFNEYTLLDGNVISRSRP